jgi:hypothetical protein
MSRRHLTFVVVAIASLVVSACNTSSPTGPRPATASHDEFTPSDSTGRIGTAGSH